LPSTSSEYVNRTAPATAPEKPAPGAGVYDDRDRRITYTGTWLHDNGTQLYAGTETFSNSPTASATFAFNGRSVSYVYTMSMNIGYANVFIDGALVSPNLDGYLAPTGDKPNVVRQKLATYSGLAPGNHTITVAATGTNNGRAVGSYATIDAFIVGVSTDDASKAVSWDGSWISAKAPQLWNGGEHYSATPGSSATFTFKGSFVTYVYAPFPNMGIADISIDGESVGKIDEYCPSYVDQASRTFAGLAQGDHTIRVTVSGTKRRAASGSYVTVDAFITAR